jgi:Transglycosylase SLT domain
LKIRLQLGIVLLSTATAFAAGPAQSRTAYDLTLKNGFTIHHYRSEVVGDQTRLYIDDKNYVDVPTAEISEVTESQEPVSAGPPELQKNIDLNQVVSAASSKTQVDPDLITSVIHAESAFNPKAVSPKGAQGLMQLMPGTAAKLGVTDAFDPSANVNAGTQYLRELLLQYNGDIAKALAAYNAGPMRVQQYHGVPPYRETRAYVAQIIKEFNSKKLAARSESTPPKTKTQASTN